METISPSPSFVLEFGTEQLTLSFVIFQGSSFSGLCFGLEEGQLARAGPHDMSRTFLQRKPDSDSSILTPKRETVSENFDLPNVENKMESKTVGREVGTEGRISYPEFVFLSRAMCRMSWSGLWGCRD